MKEVKSTAKESNEVEEHHQTIEDNGSSCQAPELSHINNNK